VFQNKFGFSKKPFFEVPKMKMFFEVTKIENLAKLITTEAVFLQKIKCQEVSRATCQEVLVLYMFFFSKLISVLAP